MDIYRTWVTNKGSSETTVMVDMKQWFGSIVINMVVRMMFGNHFLEGEQNRDRFQKAIMQFAELLGAFVPSDAIPWLRWFDLGGYEKKLKKTTKEIDVVINGWLEDHKKKMNSTSTQHVDDSRDQTVFMAALLSGVKEVKEEVYGFSTDEIVKATCLGEAVSTLIGHTQCVSSVVWPEHGNIYSGSWDHSIRRWDVETGKDTLNMFCGKVINCIDVGGESSALIAAGGSDPILRIWDPRKPGTLVLSFQFLSHTSWITTCKWHSRSWFHLLN